MPGLNLRGATYSGTSRVPQATTAPQPATSVTSAAFGPGYTVGMNRAGAFIPNDAFGVAFWVGAGAIGGLAAVRHTLPGDMKKTFDLVMIMLLLWSPAKGLAKVTAARHASQDSGVARTAARAAQIVL